MIRGFISLHFSTDGFKADIGVIGLAVMGRNLAMNMLNKGFRVCVFNRKTEYENHLAGDHLS